MVFYHRTPRKYVGTTKTRQSSLFLSFPPYVSAVRPKRDAKTLGGFSPHDVFVSAGSAEGKVQGTEVIGADRRRSRAAGAHDPTALPL